MFVIWDFVSLSLGQRRRTIDAVPDYRNWGNIYPPAVRHRNGSMPKMWRPLITTTDAVSWNTVPATDKI